jgi:dephospho-CoA kinase
MTYVIGLTGGIGSGKTTVANLFAEKGITVIDTDQLARDVILPGQAALKNIHEKFGSEVISPDGTLNRAALRKIIFQDSAKRVWLEQLLHPLIRAEMQRQIETSTSPYCIVVIPLLFETEPNPLINRILTVDIPEEEQIKRAQLRDQLPAEEIATILKTQASRELRLQKSHDVIHNHGTIKDLQSQVEKLHQHYLTLK